MTTASFAATACLLCIVALLVAPSGAAGRQLVKTQPPCGGGPDRECVSFSGQSASVFTVRGITLDQVGPGTALVLAHGSGHCENGTAGLRIADFDTQIQLPSERSPSHNGPGGERVGLSLQSSLLANNDAIAFNLSAVRLIRLQQGAKQRYLYRVALNRMDEGVSCKLYNVTLSVLYTPG